MALGAVDVQPGPGAVVEVRAVVVGIGEGGEILGLAGILGEVPPVPPQDDLVDDGPVVAVVAVELAKLGAEGAVCCVGVAGVLGRRSEVGAVEEQVLPLDGAGIPP